MLYNYPQTIILLSNTRDLDICENDPDKKRRQTRHRHERFQSTHTYKRLSNSDLTEKKVLHPGQLTESLLLWSCKYSWLSVLPTSRRCASRSAFLWGNGGRWGSKDEVFPMAYRTTQVASWGIQGPSQSSHIKHRQRSVSTPRCSCMRVPMRSTALHD